MGILQYRLNKDERLFELPLGGTPLLISTQKSSSAKPVGDKESEKEQIILIVREREDKHKLIAVRKRFVRTVMTKQPMSMRQSADKAYIGYTMLKDGNYVHAFVREEK